MENGDCLGGRGVLFRGREMRALVGWARSFGKTDGFSLGLGMMLLRYG